MGTSSRLGINANRDTEYDMRNTDLIGVVSPTSQKKKPRPGHIGFRINASPQAIPRNVGF